MGHLILYGVGVITGAAIAATSAYASVAAHRPRTGQDRAVTVFLAVIAFGTLVLAVVALTQAVR